MKNLAAAVTEWITSQGERARMKGAVLGLSGGIDSAVVGALAARACGEQALGVIMPCESCALAAEHARLVAEAVGLRTETVDLDGALAAIGATLTDSTPLARANLKARLRMMVLYHYANRLSYLVAGTGNRSEVMLGYFTKHGDGACDMLPIGGLYKAEVRELARELGVPREVIEKPPSAGLWDGQTDEGELGMSYDEVDRALGALDSGDRGDTNGAEAVTLDRVREMIERSAHKREPVPVFEPE